MQERTENAIWVSIYIGYELKKHQAVFFSYITKKNPLNEDNLFKNTFILSI